jgi:hypothetical protein
VDSKPICPIAQGVAHSGDECEYAELAGGYSICAHCESRQLEIRFRGARAGNDRERLGPPKNAVFETIAAKWVASREEVAITRFHETA